MSAASAVKDSKESSRLPAARWVLERKKTPRAQWSEEQELREARDVSTKEKAKRPSPAKKRKPEDEVPVENSKFCLEPGCDKMAQGGGKRRCFSVSRPCGL